MNKTKDEVVRERYMKDRKDNYKTQSREWTECSSNRNIVQIWTRRNYILTEVDGELRPVYVYGYWLPKQPKDRKPANQKYFNYEKERDERHKRRKE